MDYRISIRLMPKCHLVMKSEFVERMTKSNRRRTWTLAGLFSGQ